MNTIALSGTPRTNLGTKYAAQLRRTKQVPCVLYGGESTLHFSVDGAALKKLIFTPELNGAEIEIEGRKVLAMVQEKQFHPTTDEVLHVDFVELKENEAAIAKLTLRLKGQPIGVRKGGKLAHTMRKVRVSGLPAKLPGYLELDVADLDVNKAIQVSDLKFDGLTVLEKESDVVVAVKMAKKQEEAAATAAAPAAAKKAEAKPAAKK
jgi:large subunit ribosomal protein L25